MISNFFKKIKNKKIDIYQQELIKTHYIEVENMYKKMRGWRHDYKNHIQTMKIYVKNNDINAIEQYLNELDKDLTLVDTVIKTGNAMTDAILNSKISLANAKGINVIAEANIPLALNISSIDLCVVMGNLFDNAIEASLSMPPKERIIRVYMDIKNTQLYISFTNFTNDKKKKKINGIFNTTKGNGHGLGLSRIIAVVEKLHGYININSEDKTFTTEILLPQNNNSSPK